jgi:hypothetical protein
VRKLPSTGIPVEVRVTATHGDCAWGYHEVDRWTIDAEGWTTPNLCQRAAAAIFAAAEPGWAEGDEERQATCDCPVVRDRRSLCGCPAETRSVTFGVRPLKPAEAR